MNSHQFSRTAHASFFPLISEASKLGNNHLRSFRSIKYQLNKQQCSRSLMYSGHRLAQKLKTLHGCCAHSIWCHLGPGKSWNASLGRPTFAWWVGPKSPGCYGRCTQSRGPENAALKLEMFRQDFLVQVPSAFHLYTIQSIQSIQSMYIYITTPSRPFLPIWSWFQIPTVPVLFFSSEVLTSELSLRHISVASGGFEARAGKLLLRVKNVGF